MNPSPDHFKHDRFAVENGIELVEVRPGYARAQMVVADRHLNGVGVVQGGALFTLADLAFAGASNSAGPLALGLNMNISCLKAVNRGTLTAEATEVARSKRISTCTVRVTDETGDLVALFHGTAYIKTSGA
ncbi:MAG: PaaI family thioesterase [Thermoguttaceae bacterium]